MEALGAALAPGIFPHPIPPHLELSPRHNLSPIINALPAFRARYVATRAILLLCFHVDTNASFRITPVLITLQMPGGYGAGAYMFERFVLASRLRLQSACPVPCPRLTPTNSTPRSFALEAPDHRRIKAHRQKEWLCY